MGHDEVIAHIDSISSISTSCAVSRPPLDPELAPVEEARGAVFPALSDETLPEIRRQIAAGFAGSRSAPSSSASQLPKSQVSAMAERGDLLVQVPGPLRTR